MQDDEVVGPEGARGEPEMKMPPPAVAPPPPPPVVTPPSPPLPVAFPVQSADIVEVRKLYSHAFLKFFDENRLATLPKVDINRIFNDNPGAPFVTDWFPPSLKELGSCKAVRGKSLNISYICYISNIKGEDVVNTMFDYAGYLHIIRSASGKHACVYRDLERASTADIADFYEAVTRNVLKPR